MDMGRRLQFDLMKRSNYPFTHVVILAGTNDLRWGRMPEDVLRQLKVLHSMVRASGAKCIAVTIPPCGPMDMAAMPLTKQRDFVNNALRDLATAGVQGKMPPLWLADFDAVMARLPRAERNGLFSDSCHFTPQGYDLLADLVHATVMSSVPQPRVAAGLAAEGSTTQASSPVKAASTPTATTPTRQSRIAMCSIRRATMPATLHPSRSVADLLPAPCVVLAQPVIRQYIACR